LGKEKKEGRTIEEEVAQSERKKKARKIGAEIKGGNCWGCGLNRGPLQLDLEEDGRERGSRTKRCCTQGKKKKYLGVEKRWDVLRGDSAFFLRIVGAGR